MNKCVENIVWMYYACQPTSVMQHVLEIWRNALKYFKQLTNDPLLNVHVITSWEQILMNTVLHTRDIAEGKGCADHAYMMVVELFDTLPNIGLKILDAWFGKDGSCIGCWKDVKRLCGYIYTTKGIQTHPIQQWCIKRMNIALSSDTSPQNVAKWVPRESGKYSWVFTRLAQDWCLQHTPWILRTAKTKKQRILALTKCKMEYRKHVASLSQTMETQLSQRTFNAYQKVEKCITKHHFYAHREMYLEKGFGLDASMRIRDLSTRVFLYVLDDVHATMLKRLIGVYELEYSNRGDMPASPAKYQRNSSVLVYVREALNILHKQSDPNITDAMLSKRKLCLNAEWEAAISKWKMGNLNVLPILDGSWKMHEDGGVAWEMALGWAVFYSFKTKVMSRVLVIDTEPVWVELDEKLPFLERVERLWKVGRTLCKLERTMNWVSHAMIQSQSESENMVWMLFSDMSFSCVKRLSVDEENDNEPQLHKKMELWYEEHGGIVKTMPQMVYWNVGTKIAELPCKTNQSRVLVCSGDAFSTAFEVNLGLLNPNWDMGTKTLYTMQNRRYKSLLV